MAEQIQEVFWLTSADRQQLLYVSQAFEVIWGRPVESLYAYPGGHVNLILDSIHPSDRDQVVAAFANNVQSEYKQEYRIVRPDGSMRWVRSRFFPVQNPFGETWGIAGLSEDITERKQAEDILHQREQEFRALVELSPDIISRFDRELRHIYVNPAIKLATGMLPQEFLGKTNRELGMPQAVLLVWEQSLQKVFQTGETDEHEFSFLTPTGLKYYQSRLVPELAADGSVEFVLGICRDLTKNKQTEEALRESEERFRTVFESAPMGMVLANPKGMFLQTNQAFQEIFGYSETELQNLSFIELTHPADRAENVKVFQELFLGKRTHFSLEKRCFRKDGSLVWVNVSVSAVGDANGLPQYAISIIQDISDRKQAELALQQAHDELEKRVAERTAELAKANTLLQQEIAERKQAKEQLRAVLDAVPGCVSWISSEGRYLGVNQHLAQSFNLSPDALVGKELGFLKNSPEFVQFMTQFLESSAQTDRQVIETQANGSTRNYLIVAQKYNQGASAVSVGIDITESIQAQEALKTQKEFLQTVLDTNPNLIWVKDRADRVVLANRACADFFETTVEDMLGLTNYELSSNPADVEVCIAQDKEVLATLQEKFIPEENFPTPKGEVRWFQTIKKPIFSSDGQVCQILGVSTDITERKLAQEALKEQKEFLRTILDTNPNTIFVKDTEGKFVLVNQAYADIHGMSVEDLVGLTDDGLHPNQADTERFIAQDVEVITTLRQKFIPEQAYHTQTGEVRWFQTIKKPIVSSNGQVCQLLGVSTDITERKLAQEALKAQKEFLQTVLDSNPNMIFVKDKEGKIVLANQRYADFRGMSVEELLGLTDAECNRNQAEVDQFLHEDKEVNTTLQEIFIPEEACRFPTGEVRWFQIIKKPIFSSDGQVGQVLGVCTDITERKQAEELQRQTQARLRRLVEAHLIGVIFADFSGNITEANDAFLNMVGYTHEDLRAGKVRWLDMTPPEYAEDDAQARAQLRLTGVCTPHEKEYIRKDGSRVPILTGSALLEGSQQDCVSFVVDLTWHKQAETQIQASLREKEVLLQEIHHRVKNNLQVICSLLDLQSQDIEEPATLEMFRESQNRVKSMALVHEKLYQSKDFASINFAEYIENLISYLFQVYRMNASNITLELDIDEVSLNIDQAIPCGLIISELVSNALKYAFPNSQEGTITIDFNSNLNNQITLIIKDNGVGFNTNFDFTNLNSLGLKLVNVLIHQLEGTLEIDYSAGTEFKIIFLGHIC